METKFIGVVAHNYKTAFEFVKQTIIERRQVIDRIIANESKVYTKDNHCYVVICDRHQGLGYHFTEVIRSPCYYDLYTEMSARIR